MASRVEAALARVRKLCLSFPETSERLSHGAPTFFVGKGKGRSFLSFVNNHHGDGKLAVIVAAPPGAQAALVEANPEAYYLPAYVAHMGWVGVRLDRSLPWPEVASVIESAYGTVAGRIRANTPAVRFLITGGAGFLGINLARYLLERGHEVTSLDIADFDYPERDRVTVVRGDIREPADVRRALAGVDQVVHTAAALPLYTPEQIRTTDIDGTRTVLAEAFAAGVARVIHISSTAVYGIPDHHPLLEDDRLEGVGPYGEAKIAAEELCLAERARGRCVAIIRPKSFVGPERLGVFALFYEWASEGRGFPMLGSGRNRYQLLDVEDLCQAIYLCATVDAARANDTFNVGARDFTTMGEDFQAVLDAAGFGKRVVSTPAAPLIWALRCLEKLKLSPLYRWIYETAATDSFVAIEKAERVLGYAPRYSNKDALVRNYRWYLANVARLRQASGVSHRVPWKQGVLRLAKVFF